MPPAATELSDTELDGLVARGGSSSLDAGLYLVERLAGAEMREFHLPDGVVQVLELVPAGERLKDATAQVAEATGLSRRELYQAALAVKN